MTEFNCEKRCGICCIICTDIGLTMREVIGGRYQMQFQNAKFKGRPIEDGWSDRILRQKSVWIPEFQREYTTCIYFNPVKRVCTIYDSRPYVCWSFDCRQSWSNGKAIKKTWCRLEAEAREAA